MQKQPMVLTLKIDEVSQYFFNDLRQRYFPPERNFLSAHLLLYHQLPDEQATYDYLGGMSRMPFSPQVTGLMNLGAGVAYRVESKELNDFHHSLLKHFEDVLIPQDRQGFPPHITIMNKTTPQHARALITDLAVNFKPFTIQATGFDAWTYLDGPWRHERTFSFS